MRDQVDTLLVDVRASTDGFAQDLSAMRATFDGTLVDGFSRAGDVLERGITGAVRRGSLSFDDLKRVALSTLSQIAAESVRGLFGGGGGSGGDSAGGLLGLGGLLGSLLGLPGRATGGPVMPGQTYLVGERGPELFTPHGAGRIDNGATTGAQSAAREVRVSINVVSPAGSSTPQALERSSRQVASAVRRALAAS